MKESTVLSLEEQALEDQPSCSIKVFPANSGQIVEFWEVCPGLRFWG